MIVCQRYSTNKLNSPGLIPITVGKAIKIVKHKKIWAKLQKFKGKIKTMM